MRRQHATRPRSTQGGETEWVIPPTSELCPLASFQTGGKANAVSPEQGWSCKILEPRSVFAGERWGRPLPLLTSSFSSDISRPRKALASGDSSRKRQLSQTLKSSSNSDPTLPRHWKALCERACVRVRVCARAHAQAAGMPPLPSESSSFPACFGPAKWEGETQDGGSRELRL